MLKKCTLSETEILKYFADYIQRELGIIYSTENSFQLKNRLEEICKTVGETNIEALYLKAEQGITGIFKQTLLDVSTNNETSFFRDQNVFRAIENDILPMLLSRSKSDGGKIELKIWSAASSTGQEAVSTAILFEEMKFKTKREFDYRIVGTDISERALQRAREGAYTQLEVQRGLAPALMDKYFRKDDRDRWVVQAPIRQRIEFRKQNLKEGFVQIGKFDLVLCRNVLIYQNVESKKEILLRLTEQLEPGGFLVLGSGESLIGLSQDYDQLSASGSVVYRKKQYHQKVA